jgi:hypothetical protein
VRELFPKLCRWNAADAGNRCRLPDPSCYLLFLGGGIQEHQPLGPDIFSPRARETARAISRARKRHWAFVREASVTATLA